MAKSASKAARKKSNGRPKAKKVAKAKDETVKVKAKTKVKAKAKPEKTRKARAKPTRDPAKLDKFGFRIGSLKSKAAAMYASKTGATLNEVRDELESTQYNLLKELKEQGYTVSEDTVTSDNNRKVTRYHIEARA